MKSNKCIQCCENSCTDCKALSKSIVHNFSLKCNDYLEISPSRPQVCRSCTRCSRTWPRRRRRPRASTRPTSATSCSTSSLWSPTPPTQQVSLGTGGGAPGRGGRKGHEARLWSCMRFLCLKYIHTFSISEERRHGRAFRMEQPPWISFQQHVTAIPQLCYAPFIYIYI